MTDVTKILNGIEHGDREAADRLLPIVYDELRRLAAAYLAHEQPGQTLQATSLVHEAYLRLVGSDDRRGWEGRGHFFAAAAEAMRRILVEKARQKSRVKHGGELIRNHGSVDELPASATAQQVLVVHDALDTLESKNFQAAQIIKLRYFAGMTIPEAAEAIGVSPRTANGLWSYGRAWLLAQFQDVRES